MPRLLQIITLSFICFFSKTCVSLAIETSNGTTKADIADRIRKNPTDYESTYEFVELSVAENDYEAAIGALERLLIFNNGLSKVHEDLANLYAHLGAYEMAASHLKEASRGQEISKKDKQRIETQIPELSKLASQTRFNAQIYAGLRSQSNANFFPSNGLFQIGGVGYRSLLGQRPDMNTFQMAQASHDYDFDTERQATLETRISAYATQQYNLTLYNVTLFSGSTGLRFAIPEASSTGVSVKPYVIGVSSLLGGQSYLNSGGGGVTIRTPISTKLIIDPGVEARSLYVNRNNIANGGLLYSTVSTLATGNAISGYISGSYQLSQDMRVESRVAYTRANADISVQSSNQIDVQTMFRYEFGAPIEDVAFKWAVSPYVRFTHLAFDSANALVDPWTSRTDTVWMGGSAFDLPLTSNVGFFGNVEFAQNYSNISNFQAQNFSVSIGPLVKF